MIPERRSNERRHPHDRRAPSSTVDVTRAEHENLFTQVQKNAQTIERLEEELREIRQLLATLRLKAVS